MKDYLLFDLDGTLTDPKIGITKSVQYALESFGIEEPELDALEPFIGPPLKDSFMRYYEMDSDTAEAAIEKYRERFGPTGIFENEIYPGIRSMLAFLSRHGMHLAVASSKPTVYVERILEHFHIRSYFQVVVGSELDGRRTDKAEVVTEALGQLFGENAVDKSRVFMIGDREFDIKGAHALGIEAVGVAYGYGEPEELLEARADYIVGSVEGLRELLEREVREKRRSGNPGAYRRGRIGRILCVVLGFCAVEWALFFGAAGFLSDVRIKLLVWAAAELVAGGLVRLLAGRLGRQIGRDLELTHLTRRPVGWYVRRGVAALCVILGVQFLICAAGGMRTMPDSGGAGGQTGDILFWLGLSCAGVAAAWAEETVFRRILFGGLRILTGFGRAMFLSALCFGLYGGIGGLGFLRIGADRIAILELYGFLFGLLLAYVYEKTNSPAVLIGIRIPAYFCLCALWCGLGSGGALQNALTGILLPAAGAVCLILSEGRKKRASA